MTHLGSMLLSILALAAVGPVQGSPGRSSAPAGGLALPLAPASQEVRVAGIYDPRSAVRLLGEDFIVPEGKLLVMTALGSIQGGQASVQISNFWPNGLPETLVVNTLPSAPTVAFPLPGIVVRAGATVQTGAPNNLWGIVYGYLIDDPDSAAHMPKAVHIVGLPGDPREFVYIKTNLANPNLSYTVPPGKRLIVTGIGSAVECPWASVRQDRTTLQYVEVPAGALFYSVPAPGIPIDSGGVVNPVAESPQGRVIGYLIEQ